MQCGFFEDLKETETNIRTKILIIYPIV